jgi:hypothetical protein
MVLTEKPILFEAEDETRCYTWRLARAELDPVAGAITICGARGKTPTITIHIREITGFEIVPREEISTLPHLALGMLLADSDTGLGCLLSVILAPIAIIQAITSRRARVPVIKLTQSAGDGPGQGWVIHLRSRRRGSRGRVETRELAHRIADLLPRHGYSGSMPDLTDVAEVKRTAR